MCNHWLCFASDRHRQYQCLDEVNALCRFVIVGFIVNILYENKITSSKLPNFGPVPLRLYVIV